MRKSRKKDSPKIFKCQNEKPNLQWGGAKRKCDMEALIEEKWHMNLPKHTKRKKKRGKKF